MFKRLLGNASTNLLQLFVGMGVTFIMAPIYVRNMGHYDYGLREMVMAITGYMGILSLGMQPTITRFVAMHRAKNDNDALNRVYASVMAFMMAIGVLTGSVFVVWALVYPEVLAQGNSDTGKYAIFLYLVAFTMLIKFPLNVVISFVEGLQRFVFKNILNMGFTISIAVVCYHYMNEDNALLLLVGLSVLSMILKFAILSFILALPQLGALRPRIAYFSFEKLKEMLSFGLKSFIQGTASTLDKASDRLIIGGVMGPSAVPLFTIPHTLVGYANSITMTFTQVFMPMFSQLDAREQRDRLREIYVFSSKYTVAVILAMCVGIAVIGGPFIGIWMPDEFDPVIVNQVVLVLAAYIAIHRLDPFNSRFLTAINKHGFLARVMPVGALVNVLISLWLVFEMGVVGAAVGTLVPAFVLTPLVLGYCCRQLGISVTTYVQQSILPALIPVSLMAAVIIWMRFEWGLTSYSELILCVLSGAAVFAVAFLLFSCPRTERDFWLRNLNPWKRA